MKLTLRPRPLSSRGFTVIETIMVLAIAGLILTIVLGAIPALERSSRNNQRRQDVQAILRAVSHYELNNSGNFLDCGYSGHSSCTGSIASGNLLAYSKLTYYTQSSQVVVHSENPGTALGSANNNPNTSPDTVYVYNHQLCTTNNGIPTATATGAAFNDVVALYAIETAGGINSECQQL